MLNIFRGKSAFKQNDLDAAAKILEGLLASGHYTQEGPRVKMADLGKDW